MNQVKNFRTLADKMMNNQCKSIKQNMIFRSGELSHITPQEIHNLISFKIKHIYDLRSATERQNSDILNHFDIINFDVTNSKTNTPMDQAFFKKTAPSSLDFMISLYRDYLPFSPILKPLMQQIIQERHPFLFHCAAGKDRTGIVASIIMAILDFNEEQLIEEYVLLDQELLSSTITSLRNQGFSECVIAQLEPLNTVQPLYLQTFLNAIKSRFGNLKNYISEFLGLTDEQIENFKTYFLETL
jgi:protein-tyrosine phosphatase